MSFFNTLLFIFLAAIWGSSYTFMRVLAPILGPAPLACARTLIAGIVLVAGMAALRTEMNWRKNLPRYILIGIFNTGISFALLAFAAIRLPTAVPSVINALTPLWGAVFAALILKEKITVRKIVGFGFGIVGVALIAFRGRGLSGSVEPLAIAACVTATFLYGLSGACIRRWAADIPSRPMTAASLLFAGLFLLPFALSSPPQTAVPLSVWAVTAGFALLCSAVAYMIYFYLFSAAGVTVTLSVTLLQPLFTFLWGFLFIGEQVTPIILGGTALVLSGTALVITEKPTARS